MKVMLEGSESKYSNEDLISVVEKAGFTATVETHAVYGEEMTGVAFDLENPANITKITSQIKEEDQNLIKLLPLF